VDIQIGQRWKRRKRARGVTFCDLTLKNEASNHTFQSQKEALARTKEWVEEEEEEEERGNNDVGP